MSIGGHRNRYGWLVHGDMHVATTAMFHTPWSSLVRYLLPTLLPAIVSHIKYKKLSQNNQDLWDDFVYSLNFFLFFFFIFFRFIWLLAGSVLCSHSHRPHWSLCTDLMKENISYGECLQAAIGSVLYFWIQFGWFCACLRCRAVQNYIGAMLIFVCIVYRLLISQTPDYLW